ncbi:MAG: hypothetical protein J4215_01070 [Candidatus Diapherotrites archaeon]|uniref:Uncharacterized protein n=1 Tax=Candidatus Iainarchaeum sp. TaxID=3101447 RepID=A0A8T4LCS8_9ARCH|nr:hypothetical protein [Candidatus Diapherotrites archaeon]
MPAKPPANSRCSTIKKAYPPGTPLTIFEPVTSVLEKRIDKTDRRQNPRAAKKTNKRSPHPKKKPTSHRNS